jgi:prepilin-type N-terminal cleavage/methylation domain-containing protein
MEIFIMKQRRFSTHGFTLIELLIVVAIIAILAAIAVPNFLEAQTRSKVSRGKADMRAMATALEAYAVDNNVYPQCHRFGVVIWPGLGTYRAVLERLSTPVAYMTNVVVKDPFSIRKRVSQANACDFSADVALDIAPDEPVAQLNSYIYQAWNKDSRAQTESDSYSSDDEKARAWLLHSAGPDSTYHNLGGVLANNTIDDLNCTINLMYDPTNGTVSFGSVYRVGGQASTSGGSTAYAGGTGLAAAIYASQD